MEGSEQERLAREAELAKRKWRAFQIGMWTLAVTGAVLVLIGLTWPGAIGLFGAAAVRLLWISWARREQTRLDAIPRR